MIINNHYFDNLLKNIKPDLILVGSCCIDHDAYISLSAKKLGIKLASIIYSWDNPSTKGLAICKPNKVFSWNETMTQDIENFFEIEKKDIIECGILHWSNYKKDLPKRTMKDKIIISFFSSAPSNFENSYENLLNVLEYDSKKYEIKILARMHPSYFIDHKYIEENINIQKNIIEKYKNKIEFLNPKITKMEDKNDYLMNLNEDLKDIKFILTNSDIVVTQYSTILLEALILKKPLINFSTGKFRNTSYTKKNIYSKMHHLKELLEFNLIKDVDNSSSLYTEFDKILDGENNFQNYEKFFHKNLSSTNKDNIGYIEQNISTYLNEN